MKEKKTFKLLKQMVQDIHSGLTGSDLMKKYGMSVEELRGILKTISVIKSTTAADLYGRSRLEEDSEALNIIRMLPRTQVFVELPVNVQEQDPRTGTVGDISESGVMIKGIDTEVDETKSFVIQADDIFRLEPFLFDAKCRWVRKEGPERGSVGGFEITYISPEDLEKLKRLISTISRSLEEIASAAAEMD